MRTPEQKIATKQRKAAERKAHRERVFKKYPPAIRYAKAQFKKGAKQTKGKKSQRNRQNLKIKLGVQ